MWVAGLHNTPISDRKESGHVNISSYARTLTLMLRGSLGAVRSSLICKIMLKFDVSVRWAGPQGGEVILIAQHKQAERTVRSPNTQAPPAPGPEQSADPLPNLWRFNWAPSSLSWSKFLAHFAGQDLHDVVKECGKQVYFPINPDHNNRLCCFAAFSADLRCLLKRSNFVFLIHLLHFFFIGFYKCCCCVDPRCELQHQFLQTLTFGTVLPNLLAKCI